MRIGAARSGVRIALGALLLILALFALIPFIYMVLVSFTQKTVLNLDFDVSEFSLRNYERIFTG